MISYLVRVLLFIYKRMISPYIPMACRFYPTCSEYAYEAFKKHGTIKGLWLTLKRLSKCQPFGSSGIDFVPDICACEKDKYKK